MICAQVDWSLQLFIITHIVVWKDSCGGIYTFRMRFDWPGLRQQIPRFAIHHKEEMHNVLAYVPQVLISWRTSKCLTNIAGSFFFRFFFQFTPLPGKVTRMLRKWPNIFFDPNQGISSLTNNSCELELFQLIIVFYVWV